ncbi:MAG: helicase-associated domain-containing protein [Candidatus Methanospirareceae archaeon]
MAPKIKVEDRLKKLNVNAIIEVASLWGIEIKGDVRGKERKKELIKEVLKGMQEEQRVKAVLESLSDREMEILGLFAMNNWSLGKGELYMWNIMEEELGISPSTFPSYYRYYPSHIKGLLGRLLIVKTRYDHTITYVVPEDFREAISQEFSSEIDIKVDIRESEIKNRRDEAYNFLDDIFLFLSYAAKGIPLTPSLQQIPKKVMDEIIDKMKEPTLVRFNLLLAVCDVLQLVKTTSLGKKHFLVTTENVKDFFMRSRTERVLYILQALSEVYYSGIERRILEEIGKLEADTWYDRSLFLKRLRGVLFKEKAREWANINKKTLDRVFSHLIWLGLIETGIFEDRVVFRVKRSFFGVKEDEGGKEGGIVVQPNFEVIAFPETPDDILFALSYFAEIKSVDRAKVYMLTKNSILDAIDKGIGVEKIEEFLRKNARNEIPQNVLYSIREWAASYGRITIKKGVFLETDEELMKVIKERIRGAIVKEITNSLTVIKDKRVLLDLIRAEEHVFLEVSDDISAVEVEKAIGKYVIDRKERRIFVIHEEDLEKCIRALKKRGIFPRVAIDEKAEDNIEKGAVGLICGGGGKDKRDLIEEAMEKERKIRIVYLSKGRKETERIVEPYEIIDDKYLRGYCYLRGDMRLFRLDRIKEIEVV